MPHRALIEKRPWLLASLAAGIGFWLLKESAVPGLYLTLLKGAGVALLAVYALARHKGHDANTIAAVMGFGALGDVLIEFRLEAGAVAFLIGHLIAIRLYWQHRRPAPSGSQRAAALALLVLTPLVSFQLGGAMAALYALGLGGMAASAWLSSFTRYQVGLGAAMFVASDLLIFAQLGVLAQSPLPGLLIWPLYYFGQFLICVGVVGELRRRAGAA
ncbi:MAG: hypothetical protein RL339_108 [Pseudomonadota bacterium]|jgi:uncharacterized membrane protein YhhN